MKRRQGSGAREALFVTLRSMGDGPDADITEFGDQLLARLWLEGFKIVPVRESDDAVVTTVHPGAPAG